MQINKIFIPLIKGEAPLKKRLAAADGIIPGAKPAELVTILLFLTRDKEAEVSSRARNTIKKLPRNTLVEFASSRESPPPLLALLYDLVDDGDVKQALILNKSFPAIKLEKIASTETDPELLRLIAQNQEKMLKNPRIAEKLIGNPALPLVARKQVEEFFTRNFTAKVLLESGAASEEEIKEKITTISSAITEQEEEEPARETGEDLENIFHQIKQEAEVSEDREKVEIEVPEELLKESPEEEKDEEESKKEFDSLYKRINQMSVAEKIKLALLGNKEARNILIKDSNKIVALSVLQSPKITIQEIRSLAQSRNLMDEILLAIARNKQWIKDYQIRLALTTNPKTPPSIATRFLSTLRENDIKKIARDKNVAGYIARAAKRIMNAKEQRRR